MGVRTLYELGRDVNGDNHCYVAWFEPDSRIEIVFLGIDGNKNRQLFPRQTRARNSDQRSGKH